MRINRRRAVAILRGRGGAAARPLPTEAQRADWRAIVARGNDLPPCPPLPPLPPQSPRGEAPPAGASSPRPAAPSAPDDAPPAAAPSAADDAPPAAPSSPPARGERTLTVLAVAVGLTFVAQGVALVVPRAVPSAGALTPAAAPAVRVAVPPARRAAPPAVVRIARIGLRSTLVGLGVRRDGTLATPTDYDRAGWYRGGSRPGEAGPTVVVGHVDSTDGPAVFFRLRELARGDRVEVRRTDGVLVTYVVSEVRRVAKSRFPTEDVYGATPRSALRLVTCGGSFDTKRRSYRDNLVVFADVLVPPTAGGTS